MLSNAELLIPACTDLRRNILEIHLLRLHSFGRPLIGIVITARLILLKDIGTFPVQRFSQMFQQHLKGLIRRETGEGAKKLRELAAYAEKKGKLGERQDYG